MSVEADTLRKLAREMREEADRRDAEKRVKAAHVVKAAAGLGLLSLRLRRTAC